MMFSLDTERTETGELVVASLSGRPHHDDALLRQALTRLSAFDTLAVHNAGYDLVVGRVDTRTLKAGLADTLVLSWLVDERPPHGLKALVPGLDSPIRIRAGKVMFDGMPIKAAPLDAVFRYCKADEQALPPLYDRLSSRLSGQLRAWYWSVEELHLRSVVDMAQTGIPIAIAAVPGALASAERQVDLARRALPDGINPNSPQQVLRWLRGQGLDLEDTAVTTLRKAPRHPAIDALLLYREWKKILGTYLLPICGSISADGRLRASFNVAGTVTGRLSSSRPNLQNLPARRDSASLVRGLVRAPEGRALVVADYEALEFRIMQHLAGVPAAAGDVHQAVAARIGTDRRTAKGLGYALLYGAGLGKLATVLGTDVAGARRAVAGYYAAYPEVKAWRTRVEDDAIEAGEVRLPSGRVRHLPEARLGDPRALRQAVNVTCQGTAADLLKLAVVGLRGAGLSPILQVHDELMLEVDATDAACAARELQAAMENAPTRLEMGALKVHAEARVSPGWGR